MRLTIFFISSLCWLTSVNALTVDELAAEFEVYKEKQAHLFEKTRLENAQLKAQNMENAQLKAQNKALIIELAKTQDQVDNNTLAVKTVGDSIENNQQSSGWFDNTHIGGYGELHYSNRKAKGSEYNGEVDFHRFVLFFGHEFNDNLRFFSEVELEHAISGEGKVGEIELEQAYLEYDFNESSSIKAGTFLLPVGILNETHEPNTFYGVERNDVETKIIPSTWWESGIAGTMRFDNGISIDATVSSGLNIKTETSDSKAFSIRDGRGKSGKQIANDPIFGTRIKYTGLPGLELSGTVLHQTDLGQSNEAKIGSGTLFSTHVIYSQPFGPGIFTGKALWTQWIIDVDSVADKEAEDQLGYYFEPSYKMSMPIGDVGVYGRYQFVDYFKGSNKEYDIWETGANWWPHEYVVVKAGFIAKDGKDGTDDESNFNLGLGYQF